MAAERRRSETKKPFLSTSKQRRGRYDFIRRQEDGFGRTKPNLAERSQKTQYFQSDVRTNRGCSAQLAGRSGRIAGRLADRACKGIVVVIDDFDFGRKRGSVETASAVLPVRLNNRDFARTDRG